MTVAVETKRRRSVSEKSKPASKPRAKPKPIVAPAVQKVVVEHTSRKIDPDHFIMQGINDSEGPHFTVSEVGKVFFGFTGYWMRYQEGKGRFVLDGEPVGARRTEKDARYYTLSDIEKIAHALASGRHISARQLRYALTVVKAEAHIFEFI